MEKIQQINQFLLKVLVIKETFNPIRPEHFGMQPEILRIELRKTFPAPFQINHQPFTLS